IKRAQTFVLRAQGFTVTAVDNPPSGTSQGDELAVEGLLTTRQGEGAGRLDAHEVFTGPSSNGGRLELLFTALLAHGQISAGGVIRINQSGATDTRAAIIGGTGRYRNARGEVIIHPAGQTTRLTFVLLPYPAE